MAGKELKRRWIMNSQNIMYVSNEALWLLHTSKRQKLSNWETKEVSKTSQYSGCWTKSTKSYDMLLNDVDPIHQILLLL